MPSPWQSRRFPPRPPLRMLLPIAGAFLTGLFGAALFVRRDEPAVTPVHAADLTTLAGEADTAAGAPTYVEMRNVLFHVHPEIALDVRRLRGTMKSLTKGPIVFDDPRSFAIQISSADVRMSPQNLSNLLNLHVFAYPGAPLKSLKVRIEGNELVQSGRLRKGLSLPFEIRATVSLTPDGDIRIHATRTKLLGIGATTLMKGLGLRLESVVNLDKARGARVEGNDIILDVEHALPPPAIRGRLTDVRIEGGEMVQRFGPAGTPTSPSNVPQRSDTTTPNYMFYRGGVLRFGKLMMLDADMQIVDMDPRDPFRFDISRYLRQLVAGYSKTLPDGGLLVYMKDIDDVGATVSPAVKH